MDIHLDSLQSVVRTPILESRLLDARLGFRLLVKPECFQHTGAFKFHGCLMQSTLKVLFSSGNYVHAVAYITHHFGITATIVDANHRA
ncbi:MAG: hypothetical protein HRT36_08445 [Alphaproteobacteria bacterium]|nr:hypothetical protein [Alphaproteobacteria bacterium]